jgi:hypothetical protein
MAMLRRIPDKISKKLEKITTPSVVVASAQNLTEEKIKEAKLNLVGFKVDGDKLTINNDIFITKENFGSVSKENINGKEVVFPQVAY